VSVADNVSSFSVAVGSNEVTLEVSAWAGAANATIARPTAEASASFTLRLERNSADFGVFPTSPLGQ
jgi:hypothetical protein